jgi:hypothetical protein
MKFTVVLHTDDGKRYGVCVPDLPRCFSSDYATGVWAVVDVSVEKYFGPAEKINITVPRLLLRRIDSYDSTHGSTRNSRWVRVRL